jgi:hypothetical protein
MKDGTKGERAKPEATVGESVGLVAAVEHEKVLARLAAETERAERLDVEIARSAEKLAAAVEVAKAENERANASVRKCAEETAKSLDAQRYAEREAVRVKGDEERLKRSLAAAEGEIDVVRADAKAEIARRKEAEHVFRKFRGSGAVHLLRSARGLIAAVVAGEVVEAEDGKGGAFYAQPIRKTVADDVMRRLSDYLADPDAAERLQEAAAAAKVEERLGKAEQIDDAVRARLSEILGPRFGELLPKTPGPVRPDVIFSLIAYFVDLVDYIEKQLAKPEETADVDGVTMFVDAVVDAAAAAAEEKGGA